MAEPEGPDSAETIAVQERLNLHGEFLGVTSMACYSAPWHLQGVLLCLIGYMFFHRVRARSKDNREVVEHLEETKTDRPITQRLREMVEIEPKDDEFEPSTFESQPHVFETFNRFFFGFTVSKRDLATYWAGFSIYLITCAHVLVVTVRELPGVWHQWFGG